MFKCIAVKQSTETGIKFKYTKTNQINILVSKVEKLNQLDGLKVQVADLSKFIEFVHETVKC